MTSTLAKPLLKADLITKIGLTVTQVFYLVGQKAGKGLCRFVKTDALRDALSTLLAIKGIPVQVDYVRLGETPSSLKVFTSAGEVESKNASWAIKTLVTEEQFRGNSHTIAERGINFPQSDNHYLQRSNSW